jgi:hypothetical protein
LLRDFAFALALAFGTAFDLVLGLALDFDLAFDVLNRASLGVLPDLLRLPSTERPPASIMSA